MGPYFFPAPTSPETETSLGSPFAPNGPRRPVGGFLPMGDRGCPCGPNGPRSPVFGAVALAAAAETAARSPVFEAEDFAAAAEAAGALTEGFDEAGDLLEPDEPANLLWLLPAVPPEMRETEDEPLLAVLAGFEGAERVTAPALPPAGDVRACPCGPVGPLAPAIATYLVVGIGDLDTILRQWVPKRKSAGFQDPEGPSGATY